MGRRCCGDTCGHGAETENRLARCAAYSRFNVAESISANLDSITGGARFTAASAASSQDGLLANFAAKPITSFGYGPRPLSKEEVVGTPGTRRVQTCSARSLGRAASPGATATVGRTRSFLGRVRSCGGQGSGEKPGRAVPDGATRGGTGHGLDVRAYDRSRRSLPDQQASGELSGVESARK